MNYEKTLEYLYNVTPAFEKIGQSAYKEGLENTLALDEHFGHPHRNYKTIHIAGTNGKGSVSHTIAALLQAAGYRVGLYTSPHLIDFNERIRINGVPIPHERVTRFVEEERNYFEKLHPSFFELTTALAFKYFEEEKVEIAVIEVGLGGRLDCTNIITPILSVITNISYDHTDLLGETLTQIAYEKAGIIKANVATIIGETTKETRKVFEEQAALKNSRIIFSEDSPQIRSAVCMEDTSTIVYDTRNYGKLEGTLGGDYQLKNTNTFLSCLLPLARAMKNSGMKIIKNNLEPLECVKKALSDVCRMTGIMGRWQMLSQRPLVICDTGHNPGGWQYLSNQISKTSEKYHNTYIIFGMVNDKDIKGVIDLLPISATYYFTQASTHRAFNSEELNNIATARGLRGKAFKSIKEAWEAVKNTAKSEDFIFIGGSTYIVSDFLCYCSIK